MMTSNWKRLKKQFDLSDRVVSDAVLKYLEKNGPVIGLRFEQVNALTIMCDWDYISFGEELEKIYQDVVKKLAGITEEVSDEKN